MIHYFAYGSNLHPVRLQERISSAKLLGTARLAGHQISFHKRSEDGSSKCNMVCTGRSADYVYGAVYHMMIEHKPVLDGFEGPGYVANTIGIPFQGRELACFTYQAEQTHIDDTLRPYHWYKQLVVMGSSYLCFPQDYIQSVAGIDSVEDPDSMRGQEKQKLIDKIMEYR